MFHYYHGIAFCQLAIVNTSNHAISSAGREQDKTKQADNEASPHDEI